MTGLKKPVRLKKTVSKGAFEPLTFFLSVLRPSLLSVMLDSIHVIFTSLLWCENCVSSTTNLVVLDIRCTDQSFLVLLLFSGYSARSFLRDSSTRSTRRKNKTKCPLWWISMETK